MKATTIRFDTTMTQLKLLNPGLNTEGIGFLSQVVDNKLVPPPNSLDDDEDDGHHEERF